MRCSSWWLYVLLGWFLPLSCASSSTQTITPLPSTQATLNTFLRDEDANREQQEKAGFFTESGGTGTTSVTLTHVITAIKGRASGYYITQGDTSHTYTASRRTFVYADYQDTRSTELVFTGGSGCTFVPRSTRIVFAECATGSAEPDKPGGIIPLMAVDTDATTITSVTDLRAFSKPAGGVSIDTYTSLANAISSIGSTDKRTLVINRRLILGTNNTVTSNITLACVERGLLDFNTGVTLAINGPFDALPMRQCFGGAGVAGVTFGGPTVAQVYPEWFGAVGDFVANDTAAINAAIIAAGNGDRRRTVWFGQQYRAQGITLTGTAKMTTLNGHGQGGSRIKAFSDTDHVIKAINASLVTGLEIRNLQVSCLATATWDGIHLENVALFTIDKVAAAGCLNGIQLGNGTVDGVVSNSILGTGNTTGLRLSSPTTDLNVRITDNWIDENLSIGVSVSSRRVIVAQNHFQDNTGHHIFIDPNAQQVTISHNELHAGGGATLTAVGIRVDGNNNTVESNVFTSDHATEISVSAGATSNVFLFNRYLGVRSFSDAGTTTDVLEYLAGKLCFGAALDVCWIRNAAGIFQLDDTGLNINSITGNQILAFKQAAVSRWIFQKTGTETGGNTGSNMCMARYTDAGVFIEYAFCMTRSNGNMLVSRGLQINNIDAASKDLGTMVSLLSKSFALNLAAPAVPGCVDSAAQTLNGSVLGGVCSASMDVNMQASQQLSCFVNLANQVTFRVCQFAGAAADPDGAGANYRAEVRQY